MDERGHGADLGLTTQGMLYEQHLVLSRFVFDGTNRPGFAINEGVGGYNLLPYSCSAIE